MLLLGMGESIMYEISLDIAKVVGSIGIIVGVSAIFTWLVILAVSAYD